MRTPTYFNRFIIFYIFTGTDRLGIQLEIAVDCTSERQAELFALHLYYLPAALGLGLNLLV